MIKHNIIVGINYSLRDLLFDGNNCKVAICVTYGNDVSAPSRISLTSPAVNSAKPSIILDINVKLVSIFSLFSGFQS